MKNKDYGDGIGLNLEPEPTCATCRWFVEWGTRNKKPVYHCEGNAAKHVGAKVNDDSGFDSWFEPPATFCCNGWEAIK